MSPVRWSSDWYDDNNYASFSPAESSECSLSVSLALSSLGSGTCAVDGTDGGPFSLRLLPAVGCRSTDSAIVNCAEELSSNYFGA